MNLATIKQHVSTFCKCDISQVSRKRNIVYARWMYFKLCRKYTKKPLKDIAKSLNMNHATVLHGLRNFDLLLHYEPQYVKIYEDIKYIMNVQIKRQKGKQDPEGYYRKKYRVKLLQSRMLYNYNKELIFHLKLKGHKYTDKLKTKLNQILNKIDKDV